MYTYQWTKPFHILTFFGCLGVLLLWLDLLSIISLESLTETNAQWDAMKSVSSLITGHMSRLFFSMLQLHFFMGQKIQNRASRLGAVLVLALNLWSTIYDVLRLWRRSEAEIGAKDMISSLALPVLVNAALSLSWLGWKWDGDYVHAGFERLGQVMATAEKRKEKGVGVKDA